jgi:energy-converting hydrogenase Eha subunit A
MLYLPEESVEVPVCVPDIVTDTPARGALAVSVTVPVTVVACEKAATVIKFNKTIGRKLHTELTHLILGIIGNDYE